MKEETKITIGLLGLAFFHINAIAVSIVFLPDNVFVRMFIIGNALFLVLNGIIFGLWIAQLILKPSIAKEDKLNDGDRHQLYITK